MKSVEEKILLASIFFYMAALEIVFEQPESAKKDVAFDTLSPIKIQCSLILKLLYLSQFTVPWRLVHLSIIIILSARI